MSPKEDSSPALEYCVQHNNVVFAHRNVLASHRFVLLKQFDAVRAKNKFQLFSYSGPHGIVFTPFRSHQIRERGCVWRNVRDVDRKSKSE